MTVTGTLGKPKLGKLVAVDPREVWRSESGDFTPWLALEENIAVLGETIGLDLEVDSTEKGVGSYRADILCKDTTTSHWVLIENQLEKTDHIHLGQILTYAAGLDAATIVWVAWRFTEEHRATLDWLNRITDESFNFFGLEIQVWCIGDSAPAPKFNIVSQPNDWAKTIKETAGGKRTGLSDTQQLHLDFWTQFAEFLRDRDGPIKPLKPSTDYWKTWALGRGNFYLQAMNGMRDDWSGVQLWIGGPQKLAFFHLLKARQAELEQALGPLRWDELPDNKESHIVSLRKSTPRDPATWPELNEWFAERLEKMRAVFAPIVRSLDASAYSGTNEEMVMGTPALTVPEHGELGT